MRWREAEGHPRGFVPGDDADLPTIVLGILESFCSPLCYLDRPLTVGVRWEKVLQREGESGRLGSAAQPASGDY